MTKPINPYKPVVDRKFIIEQAENNDMSVWEFLKGFVVDDELRRVNCGGDECCVENDCRKT